MGTEEIYDRYWSDGVSGWCPVAGLSTAMRDLISSACSGKHVLDYGCGDGERYAAVVRACAGAYVAADISPAILAKRESAGDRVVSVHDLDQLDSEFDVVLALEVLEHLLDPIGAFSSATKLLRPGGIAIVSVPNAFNWRNRLRMLFGRLPASGVGPPGVRGHTYDAPHIRFFDLASFRHALERVGLKRIQSMTDSPDLSRMSRFLPDRMWRLSETRALFATTLVAVGKKEPCR